MVCEPFTQHVPACNLFRHLCGTADSNRYNASFADACRPKEEE
jgi:hypothetical protein